MKDKQKPVRQNVKQYAITLIIFFSMLISIPKCGYTGESMLFPDNGIWGLNLHYIGHEGIKPLGVQWVRIGTNWCWLEKGPQRGQYDWTASDKDIAYYDERGFNIIFILGAEDINPLYKADADNKELIIDAIVRYMSACAQRYKGKRIIWEILNEPKTWPMDDYWSNAANYADMARKAAKAMKQVDPNAKIAAMSLGWMDRDYAALCLQAGLLNDGTIDMISYHGYHRNNDMPESGLAEDVNWLRDQIRLYTPEGKKVSVIDSECGYGVGSITQPRHWSGWRLETVSESQQAAYLARHFLESINLGLEVSIWYKDMGESFALYTGDETSRLRPMGHVYRNLALLMPENPLKLKNDQYSVSLVDLPDDIPSPDSFVKVRSYLQTSNISGKKAQRLIVAIWNPVDAFDGKILDSRTRIGEDIYDAWRPVSPCDKVEIPVQVRITGPKMPTSVNVSQYNILAEKTEEAAVALEASVTSSSILTAKVSVGPLPTVLIFDLDPKK